MRYNLLFIFVLFLGSAMAQDSMLVAGGQEEVNILYRNEASGGLVVHSNGFGVTFKRGWHLTGYKKHLLDRVNFLFIPKIHFYLLLQIVLRL